MGAFDDLIPGGGASSTNAFADLIPQGQSSVPFSKGTGQFGQENTSDWKPMTLMDKLSAIPLNHPVLNNLLSVPSGVEGMQPGVMKAIGEQMSLPNIALLGTAGPILGGLAKSGPLGKAALAGILSYFGKQGAEQAGTGFGAASAEPAGGQRRYDITQGSLGLAQALPVAAVPFLRDITPTSGIKAGDISGNLRPTDLDEMEGRVPLQNRLPAPPTKIETVQAQQAQRTPSEQAGPFVTDISGRTAPVNTVQGQYDIYRQPERKQIGFPRSVEEVVAELKARQEQQGSKPPFIGGATDVTGQSGVTPITQEQLQGIRPAVRTMDNEVKVGQQGQSHNDIIEQNKLAPTDIDRRLFVDAQGKEISREELAKAGVPGVPESVPGAHSTGLAEVQKKGPRYIGAQENFMDKENPIHLFNLEEPIVGPEGQQLHSKGSTVSEGTLKKYNIPYEIPQKGGIGQGMKSAVEKNKEGGSVALPSKDDFNWAGRQFVSQTEKILRDKSLIGFAPGVPVDAEQLKNRLRNKLGAESSEWKLMQSLGIDKALQGKMTSEQAAEWVKENSPKVEVRKFGVGSQTKEQKEYAQLRHEWFDKLPREIQNGIHTGRDLEELTPSILGQEMYDFEIKGNKEFLEKARRFKELNQAIESTGDRPQSSHWQSIAPKSEKDMPGYVEIAVVKPHDITLGKTDDKGNLLSPYTFPSSHNFPPNTLGFVRGYMENVGGKKVFHVIEVQSDWAQRVRDTEADRGVSETVDKNVERELKQLKDPLLPHYERLALKAAIEHARQEGADAIAISDAETAMMTEGHDRQGNRFGEDLLHQATKENKGTQVFEFTPKSIRFEDAWKELPEKWKAIINPKSGEGYSNDHNYIMYTDDGNRYIIKELEGITQASGMRLHYDRTLPKIAEELTGEKGERVEMGEHRMAKQPRYEQGQFENPTGTTERDMEWVPRKDLIFRNPDGTPKTSVSGRIFSIKKPSERLSSGEPMTAMGKTYGGIPFADPEIYKQMAKDAERLSKPVIEEVSKFIGKMNTTEAISRKFDSIRGVSQAIANQVSNNIKGNLRRAVGEKNLTQAESALSLIREVQEDKGRLEQQLRESSKLDAQPKWKKQWVDAANFALQNWDKLEPISKQYAGYTDKVLSRLSEVDKPVEKRSGYVRHLPEEKDNPTGFRHTREYDTFFDRIAAGSDPKTLNSVELLKSTIYDAQRSYIQSRAFNKYMETVKDPKTKKPIAVPLEDYEKVDRGAGRQPDVRPPSGYVEAKVGGQRVAILKDYAGLMARLTNLSIFDTSPKAKAVQQYAGLSKHVQFAVDIVHLARMARREMFAKAGSGEAPLPTFKKGILTLDYTPDELKAQAKEGKIDEKELPELLRRREINNKLIQGGFNVGHYSDAIRQSWLEKIPVTGQIQRFIFGTFTRGAMAEVGPIVYDLYKKQYPNLTEEQLIGKTVKDLNFQFANMGKQGWFKSATGQDIMRLFLAAPQWTEATPRYEAQAIGGTVSGVAKTMKNLVTDPVGTINDPSKRPFNIQSRTVGSMILAYLIGNQIINQVTTGHTTFDNEEGHKLDAWIPTGKDSGYWVGPEAAALETVHRVEQVMNKSDTVAEGVTEYLNPKLSVPARGVATLLTGHKYGLTGPEVPKEQRTKAALENAIPVPIVASSMTKETAIPQVLRSAGLEGDVALTDRQKMYQAARAWEIKNNIKRPEGDFPESKYLPLTNALRKGDIQTAQKLYEELKGQVGDKLVRRYYEELPKRGFTSSQANEERFKQSLDPKQLESYQKAQQSNEIAKQKFFEMLGESAPAEKPQKKKGQKKFKMFSELNANDL